MTTRKFVQVKHFEGMPKASDFQIIEEPLPVLKNGGK